jgi:ABC-type multidrug transport system fused ATPase/permease subunit
MDNIPTSGSFASKLKFFLQVLQKHRAGVVMILFLEVLFALLNAIVPYFTKLQVDQLQTHATSLFFFNGWSAIGIFALLLIAPVFLEFLRLTIFERIDRRIKYRFNSELQLNTEHFVWQKLDALDAGFFENKRNDRILNSTMRSTSITRDFFDFVCTRLRNLTTVAAILPLLGLVSPQLLVFVGVITFLQVALNEVTRKQELALNTLEDRQREKFWRIESTLINSFHTLKMLGAADAFLDQYWRQSHERDEMNLKREEASQAMKLYEWILRNGLTFGANLFVGYQVLQGTLSLGTFTLVVSYTLQLNGVFRDVLESTRAWRDIDLQFDRLQFFLFLKSRIKKVAQPIESIQSPTTILFEKVKFKYPDFFAEERKYLDFMIEKTKGFLTSFSSYHYQWEFDEWKKMLEEKPTNRRILDGVSLTIQKGNITALLGRNGAGKTTITHLAMHHYEPVGGKVLLDGRPLYEYDPDVLVQQFGVIHQTPFILCRFSIRENIILGVNRPVEDAEIWELLEKIDMAEFIRSTPGRLDVILGEGVSLSGGQEQLLAVARVLLQRRPFLIFDEGMNQMDIEHETKVVNLLKEQSAHAGILFITHRITTARKADMIYMLDEGKVAESGSHAQLLASNGLYAQFWKMQVIE